MIQVFGLVWFDLVYFGLVGVFGCIWFFVLMFLLGVFRGFLFGFFFGRWEGAIGFVAVGFLIDYFFDH